MAEAHSAVAFSFSITHEGWDINYDHEVLNLVWESGVRSWKKRFARFMNKIHNGVYPAHVHTMWLALCVAMGIHFSGYRTPFDLVNIILPYLPGQTMGWQMFASGLVGIFFWLCICYTMRYTLKLLFMYKGWMYEARGPGSKPSLKTKLWVVLVRIFLKWNKPSLYSFQGSLPRLPLPSVHDTLDRYLQSARPLLDDANYERIVKLAQEFENGIAKKLQWYLVLKSWWSTNYVSDWWEEYVYLRGRGALMVNSNFYGIDAIFMHPTTVQAARAASVTHILLNFRRTVERQELEPIMVQGLVPLCSWQYERIFNTVRVPGRETDKIVHYPDSNHIVVLFKGCYYKMVIYHKGRILKPCELQIQFENILASKATPLAGEERVAALTAWNRTKWAETRETVFSRGANKTSLYLIESAAFILSLDEEPYEFDIDHPEKLDHYGKVLLHGNGHNRWFDKSFTVCIGTNGRVGFNAEHTWADAAVMSHVWESMVMEESDSSRGDALIMGQLFEIVIGDCINAGDAVIMGHMAEDVVGGSIHKESGDAVVMGHAAEECVGGSVLEESSDAPVMGHCWEFVIGDQIIYDVYDENGNTKGTPEFEPPVPTRLSWDLNDEKTLGLIQEAYVESQQLLNDVDLRILVHNQYGKGFMKTCKLSPDAYIQMALQLAYYRDAGKFSLTYEASMTRLFREGRTETVRPCTIESAAWVKSMEDPNFTTEERVALLKKASLRHQRGYQDAMCGKGIDRHLFCLYVVSKYLEVDSPFLKEVLSEPWRLSTSQTPHGQTNKMDLKKYPNCISAGGGFGPVADDGYGVSYIVAGEDLLFFHISSKKSCDKTSSEGFAQQICKSLADIRLLFEDYKRIHNKPIANGSSK